MPVYEDEEQVKRHTLLATFNLIKLGGKGAYTELLSVVENQGFFVQLFSPFPPLISSSCAISS